MLIYVILLLTVTSSAFTQEEDSAVHTVKYDSENFSAEIAKNNHFVMFYAPWCGHCKRLHPTWEELAEMLNTDGSNVKIAKVDCTTDGVVCNLNDVTGYPTLKFFKLGDSEGVKFKGTRDLPSLTAFINEQLSLVGETDALPIQQGLKELTDENFESTIASGKHFVKFYAPWCGHCQKLAPVWEELARNLEFDETVTISKVDCTQYSSICNSFEVRGYPTLLWIEDGKKIDKYQEQRTVEALKNYVTEKLGSQGKSDVVESDESNEIHHVIELTGDSFQSGIENGVTFVKFFAPWCGHCKRLAPTWEDLGKKFVGHPDVDIVKVDCTLDVNKNLCNEEEVEGFPTVFLYKNGKKISEYNGNRSLQDLYEFVNQHLSAHDEL